MTTEIIGKEYLIVKYLDCGATSTVYMVKSIEKGTIYAAKVFVNHSKYFFTEVEALKRLSLENNNGIINLIEYGDEPIIKDGIPEKESSQYIIMDYLANNDLFMYVKQSEGLNEEIAKLIFYKILKAVEHCHKSGICHRDLKLENILLNENNNPILCDFGYAGFIKDSDKFTDFIGTNSYASPEILEGIPYDGIKSDIFSLGVLLFCMIFCNYGFADAAKQNKMYRLIIRKKYSLFWEKIGEKLGKEKVNNISPEFKQLFFKMVSYSPNERPSIKEILHDNWMKSILIEEKIQ
jgi:serine/threonine protein kinase